MFLINWDEADFGNLNFYDMYEILYPKINAEAVPYVADENPGVGALYRIPVPSITDRSCVNAGFSRQPVKRRLPRKKFCLS